jgi:hypothetical protein
MLINCRRAMRNDTVRDRWHSARRGTSNKRSAQRLIVLSGENLANDFTSRDVDTQTR